MCVRILTLKITGGNKFDQNTENAVITWQKCIAKLDGKKLPKEGVVDGAQLASMNGTMDESGIMKWVPQSSKKGNVNTTQRIKPYC